MTAALAARDVEHEPPVQRLQIERNTLLQTMILKTVVDHEVGRKLRESQRVTALGSFTKKVLLRS